MLRSGVLFALQQYVTIFPKLMLTIVDKQHGQLYFLSLQESE
jgi:hypothetical protein